MEKKINLEEILKRHSNICFDDYEGVILAMKDAIKQALELAAENAQIDNLELRDVDGMIYYGDLSINEKSILDTIKQVE